MKILGIETSCDETAVALVEDGWNVRANIIQSSVEKHKKTGGIIPEAAARDAAKKILPAIQEALLQGNCGMADIDAIAVTAGPGLMGSLLVGVETARTLAYIHQKPLIPVQHITGHICANRLKRVKPPSFPALVLTVSGGHNDLVIWKNEFEFEVLGRTLDDAAGEAFDKGARMLGLDFPGGPAISLLARQGYEKAYSFPRPMMQSKSFDFSFSGLKTALLYTIRDLGGRERISKKKRADLAASFQEALADTLSQKLLLAAKAHPGIKEIHLTGGVSANSRLRHKIFLWTEKMHLTFHFPENTHYCSDNGAMIAGAAFWKQKNSPKKEWAWQEVQATPSKKFF